MAMSTKEYALLCKAVGQKLPSVKSQLDSVLTSTNQAANVALLEVDISASYTEAEVQALADKIDAVITALIAAGLMASS